MILKSLRSPRPFLVALAFGLWLAGNGSSASAQVIEIADDGSARTFSGPTQFVADSGPQAARSATPAVVVNAASDVYERAARVHGVDPALLRAIAWRESRGNNAAVSNRGAMGTMQLMPTTAAELGVDPRDPEQNVRGGAAYFARQYRRFRSVPLALAAYNAGPEAVARWGGIPPYAETRAYVAAIMQRWQPRTLSQ